MGIGLCASNQLTAMPGMAAYSWDIIQVMVTYMNV